MSSVQFSKGAIVYKILYLVLSLSDSNPCLSRHFISFENLRSGRGIEKKTLEILFKLCLLEN